MMIVFQNTARSMLSLICFFMAATSLCQSQMIQVNMKPVDNVNYYQWISFLTQSAIEKHPNPTPGATLRALRVVLASVEGEERIYLETVTLGPNECCNRIDTIFMVDLGDLAWKYSLEHPLTEVTFSRWLSTRSFSFKTQEKEFMISLSDDNVLRAEIR